MGRVSRQTFSKPAKWIVQRRIRQRMGYRAVQVLEFIRDHMKANGRPPSYREICEHFGIEKANLHKIIVSLEIRGEVSRADRTQWAEPILRLPNAA